MDESDKSGSDDDIVAGGIGSDDGTGWTVIDPVAIGGGSGGEPRRRGRPRGTGAKGSDKAGAVGGFDLREILVSVHSMLAIRLNQPAMELTKEQAGKIQQAVKLVEKHHRIGMSQRHMDYAMAGWLIAEIYVPMAVTMYAGSKAPKPSVEPAPVDPTILPFMRQQ